MFQRLLEVPKDLQHSIFLFGPRGTGKTSWLKQHFADAIYFDLLNDDTYTELSARPTRLSDRIPQDYTGWVIIDEVQKIPAILDEVHRLIEGRELRFVLTGSSARKLKQHGVNLLAGRALTYHMHTLTAAELQSAFDGLTALQNGLLPMAVTSKQVKRYLSSYVATYLREEVMQESLTRNMAMFSRFLETASFSQGEVLNYTAISREVAISRHTVANFFDILEDLLIAIRLPVFNKRAKRDLVLTPKFYYFDVGVYRSIRPQGPLDSVSELDGAAYETLLLQHLRAYNDYFELGYSLHYWRTRDQKEVDFVLYGNNGFHAFEVKRKASLDKKDMRGLRAFGQDYPEAKRYLIYGGEQSYHDAGVDVIPMNQCLQQLPELLKSS